MKKINFKNSHIIEPAKVIIEGLEHEVIDAIVEEVDVDLSAETFNEMQDNIEDEIDTVNSNLGTNEDTYNSSKIYAVGEIVIYNNKLYRCTTAITVGEEFDINKWEQTSLIELNRENIITGTEHATNEWIDGKRVYRKRINYGVMPNTATQNIETNLSMASYNIIRMNGTAFRKVNEGIFPLPFVSSGKLDIQLVILRNRRHL